ncbi:tRNA-guanine transglycosylase [Aureobasidium pullulans]|uniref:Queuine tRNA-ribosyltransferase accessory subunit 2 n=1 Tax=Aureobasidium pullulans TaxID=5580 RepID=A0A4S8ZU44_AURPU|nr:tRNA-guanine transglycosylase [Aureobasidium pullulans]
MSSEEMSEENMFSITRASTGNAARTGLLNLPNRQPIKTPHYLALASRGAIPHLTQDNVAKHTDIRGAYMAVEDFVEKGTPILKYNPPNGTSRLRAYTATPDNHLLVLGARRSPPVPSPGASTDAQMAIMTAFGFTKLQATTFRSLTSSLDPDIVVGLGDIPYGYYKVSYKKIDKITDRTARWMQAHVQERAVAAKEQASKQPMLYAPLLPLSCDAQRHYTDHLEDVVNDIHGLAIYSTVSMADLPAELQHLPRLGLTEPNNPRAVLQDISHGIDVTTLPFLSSVTDAGIALDIRFPVANPSPDSPLPLGVDMWDTAHATDISALREGCPCYACTNHHRAFLQHLLSAKEMLAWVLLQIHNHQVMDEFFQGVRESIERGTFEQDVADFERVYEPEFPETGGRGPRLRGYQFKSEGPNERKRNPAPFTVYKGKKGDQSEKIVEKGSVPVPGPDAMAEDLEKVGFAEKAE